ncbi:MAG TPA: hypothetical protein VNB64_13730 [Solirubrobacteraceae bacterium]|nr:hypothetical protein [Solirubrobacteraceae bacterium]
MFGTLLSYVRQHHVALLALSVALGGSAYAASDARRPANPRLYACVKRVGGDMRAVGARTRCLRTERKVSWNRQGIRGLRGSSGPTGPQGPQGPQGGQGTAGQDATAPAGGVMFFNLASCPTGWSELVAAQGRYLVGVPAGGTLGGTSGTPLGNQEDRPVGRHAHPVTDPGHSHTIRSVTGAETGDFGLLYGRGSIYTTAHGPQPSASGITVANAGSVAGTNAPYLQLRVCQKG